MATMRRLIGNNSNLIDSVSTTDITPASGAILENKLQRTGTAIATITGDYVGAQDAVVEVVISDIDATDNPIISNPVASGPGTGSLINITCTGLDAQDFSVELVDEGLTLLPAATEIGGVRLVAKVPGNAGNLWSVSVNRSGLVFSDTDFSLVQDLKAGTETITDSGAAFEWDTKISITDGVVPDDAHRIIFGTDDSTIYTSWKSYSNGWQYHFEPAIERDIPKGTLIRFVTGGRTVTLTNGSTTETYTSIITLYDLLNGIREKSTAIDVDGIIAKDRSRGGQALLDLSLRTDAYAMPTVGSSEYATEFENIIIGASAKTELIVAECWAVTERDHPAAAVGKERWKLTGSVSGSLDDALITGAPYTHPDGLFSLTIPTRLPEGFADRKGTFRVSRIALTGDRNTPKICVEQMTMGAKARDMSITLVYTARPTGGCITCTPATITGALNAEFLGLDSLPDIGAPANYQADADDAIFDLNEDTQNNSYISKINRGAFQYTSGSYGKFYVEYKMNDIAGFTCDLDGFVIISPYTTVLSLIKSNGSSVGKIRCYFSFEQEKIRFLAEYKSKFDIEQQGAWYLVRFNPGTEGVFWGKIIRCETTQTLSNSTYYYIGRESPPPGSVWTPATAYGFSSSQAAQDYIDLITSGTSYGSASFFRYFTAKPNVDSSVYAGFHSSSDRASYNPPLSAVQIGNDWYVKFNAGVANAYWQADLSASLTGYTTQGILASQDYLVRAVPYILTDNSFYTIYIDLPYFISARPVFASQVAAEAWINEIYIEDSGINTGSFITIEHRTPGTPYTPFITCITDALALYEGAATADATMEDWLILWEAIMDDVPLVIAGTKDGTSSTFRFDNYGTQFEDLIALIGSSNPVWADDTGEDFYWVINDGMYLPAFTNQVYHSAFINNRGFIESAQEFAFVVVVADACISTLAVGDTITLTIGNSTLPSTYKVGDTLTLPTIASTALPFVGGQDGNNTQRWTVTGSVVGPLSPYLFVTTAPANYSNGGLTMRLSPGGVQFGKGSKFEFSVEGGHYIYRIGGGALWSSDAIIYKTPVALGASGLYLTFSTGTSPSFISGDAFEWTAFQPYAPAYVMTPNTRIWKFPNSTASIVLDMGTAGVVPWFAMVLHVAPSNMVLTLDGGSDGVTFPLSTTLSVGRNALVVKYLNWSNTRYLRVNFSNASGCMVRWIWAGNPFAPFISGAIGTMARTYNMAIDGADNNSGGILLGAGYEFTLSWPLGGLTKAEFDILYALIESVKTDGDMPFIFVPDIEDVSTSLLVQLQNQRIEFSELQDFAQPIDYGMALSLRGWVR